MNKQLVIGFKGLLISLIVILNCFGLTAQCPSITNSTFSAACIGSGSPCTLCADQTITLHAIGTNLPNPGCVKWYYSQTSGFNPYNNEGTLIGCGAITGNNSANVNFNTTDVMCNNGTFYVVGIIDPLDQTICPQVFTSEFSFQVDCPNATIGASDTIHCERFPLYLYSSGGVSYNWLGPQGYFSSNLQNPVIDWPSQIFNEGTYYVTVTDALGCKAVKDIDIAIGHISLSTTPYGQNVVFCEGQSGTSVASIVGGGSGNYIVEGWYTENNQGYPYLDPRDSFLTADFTLTSFNPGWFVFVVIDAETGCLFFTPKLFIKLPPIAVIISPNPLQVCPGGTVTALATPYSGTAPYTFAWNTGETSAQIQIHDPGYYEVVVTDSKGCTGKDSITVTPGNPPDVSIDAPSKVFCPGGSKLITAQANGGLTPYTFNWMTPGGSSSGPTVNANITGTYIVTVTDKIGCTDTVSVFMMQNPDIILDINPNPAIFCLGGSVPLTATDIGGSGNNYQYTWTTPSGSATGSVVIATVAGIYSVTVTDGEGCKKSTSIPVQQIILKVDINPNPAEFCPGGSIDLTTQVSGGNGTYTYNWVTPTGTFNTEIVSASVYGTYSVTVTDGNGCTGKTSVEVKPKAEMLVIIKAEPPVICNGGTVKLTATAFGGASTNYTFDWTTPSGTDSGQVINTEEPGIFTVTVTDGGFCNKVASIELKISELNVVINPNPAVICNNAAIPLSAIVSGGTGKGYVYNWTTPTGPVTGPNISATITGNYTITVSDDGGCFKVASINVSSTSSLLVKILPDPTGFCTGSSVYLSTKTIGGTGIYTYQWTTPSGSYTTDTISTGVKGVYNVTVTDNNGCSGTTSTSLNENPNPDISIAPIPAGFCPGTSIQITASSTDPTINSYKWITPSGTQTGDKINAGIEGNYFVTITNNNGCTAFDSIYVKQYPAVDVSINPDPASYCIGSSVQLSAISIASGNINYNWNTPAGSKTGNAINAYVAGNYIVTASNSDGCSASDTVLVTQISSIPVSISPTNPGFCTGSNIILSANATGSNLSYSWTTPIGSLSGKTININIGGTYSVTVTDGGGCTGTASIDVMGYPVLDIVIDPNPASFCNTGSTTLTAFNNNGTVPLSYNWSTPLGSGNNPTFNANTAGIYLVTVTDVHGCSGTATSQVTQSNSLTISFQPINPGFCPGKTLDLTATANGGQAPYTYNWNTPIGSSSQTIITSGTAGTYQLTITDSNDCSGIGSIDIKELSTPSLTLPASYGFCKGSMVNIKAIAIDILTPLSYNWTTPSGSSVLDSLTATVAGNYIVTVTNAQGCSSIGTTKVDEWPLPLIQFSPDPVQICKGSSVDLSAIVSVGLAPYTYNWQVPSGSFNTNPINVSIIGTYTLTVTDANGCSSSTSIDASESPGLNVNLTTDPKILCEVNKYNIISQTTGGNQPYTYNWIIPSGTQNTASINVIDFGIFNLTVTDTKGCTGSSAIITKDESLSIELDKTDPGCIALKSGSITLLSALNAGYPLQLKLNNNPPVNITSLPYILEPLTAGNYQLIITAPNGCQKIFDLDLSAPSTPSLALGDDVTIFLGESYTIIPIANFAIDTITWTNKSSLICSPGCIEPIATPTVSTHYKATAYSKDGCKAVDDINIYVVEKESVYIPNSFSPNGDGINDQWLVFTDQTVKQIKKMYIYDRWGEAILIQENFPPNDLAYGWNGKFRNQLMNDAVFVFYVQVEFNDGRVKEYKGDINLLR